MRLVVHVYSEQLPAVTQSHKTDTPRTSASRSVTNSELNTANRTQQKYQKGYKNKNTHVSINYLFYLTRATRTQARTHRNATRLVVYVYSE